MLRVSIKSLWDALDEEWGEEPSMDLQNFICRNAIEIWRNHLHLFSLSMHKVYALAMPAENEGFFSVVVVRISPGSSEYLI